MNMKNMLEQQFPGVVVVLANYPPSLPKRILSKVVPVVQFGVVGMMLAGDQIFPRLGFAAPPQWYHSLRANRFGSIASTWMLGNFVQNFLQSSGAFEVYCNGHLVRFPPLLVLRAPPYNLVSRRILYIVFTFLAMYWICCKVALPLNLVVIVGCGANG